MVAQLAGKVAKKKLLRKVLLEKMDEQIVEEEESKRREVFKDYPGTFGGQGGELPLWKQKHEEMDRKKAEINEKWKRVRKQVSATEAFKLRNDRKFHPR